MRESSRLVGAWLALVASLGPAVAEDRYAEAMGAIARDIAALASAYPQLARFSAGDQAMVNLSIDYAYHTHRSTSRGGWTAAAPAPDDDGIWFAINFHDPDSLAQIDTQPVMPARCIGAKRVTFLILEGRKTKPVAGRLLAILKKHGVADCPSPP